MILINQNLKNINLIKSKKCIKMNDKNASTVKEEHEEVIYLRNYSKSIFLFPSLLTSFLSFILIHFLDFIRLMLSKF